MQAVVMHRYGPVEDQELSVERVDVPQPGTGQVLIKVAACGVCRSNLHMIEGDWPGVPSNLPIIPGHEVVGRVEEVGAGVEWFHVGDRVGVQPLWKTCGHCEYCLTGRDELCQDKEITGETVDGGYAEFMVAEAAHTYLLPDNLDDGEAAPLFCPGITAYGAVQKAHIGPGRRVAVFGVGGVGHMVMQVAQVFGAEVIAVTRGAAHRALADQLGAVRVMDPTASNVGEVLAAAGGVDASIVFAPSSEVVADALTALKPGGSLVVGVNARIGALPFATEKIVVGSLLGTRQQMSEVLGLAAAGKIRAVVERHSLAEAKETLVRLKHGEISGRAVLVP
jgi:propanol-preferring alcohol dehydrogenase